MERVKYNPQKIEKKWQAVWAKNNFYKAKDSSKNQKFYVLVEFPYPSGDGLHVGHCRSFSAFDAVARKKRMQGFNVLYPMGWDAFGLPAENYAIKTGIHPSITVKKNIANFKRQMKSLGLSFDWDREINTTDPKYYKWTQWIFLQLFKHNLAYKRRMPINWCSACKTGLANEEVVEGKCERCGNISEQKEKEQWMLKITKYADRLIKDLDTVDYLDKIKSQQINWIGRSEGINFKETIKDLNIEVEVYDSIPQTYIAQTFTVIAPEHPLVEKLIHGTQYEKPVMEFVENIKKKKLANQFDIEKEMGGIFTGRYIKNPFGKGDLPIWIASYVVADYGTGMVNCSAHDARDFAFAKKYGIPLRIALLPKDGELAKKVEGLEVFYREPDGLIQEPLEFKGMRWDESRDKIIDYIVKNGLGKKTVQYKLRDWVFSRQHYWGEPIPIIHCAVCGAVPVPEKDLPVKLPFVKNYQPTGTGESPLAAISSWVNTKCPKCGDPAKRETDTMPNWAGSSWYFMRYIDPKNDKMAADPKKLKYWMPVDWYNGGMEHTTLHLLYSRFWYKFLYDIKVVPQSEPYAKRTSHGVVLAEDNQKMSKSRGNVVNPDSVIKEHGADTLRVYEMFMGPFDQMIAWDTKGIIGVRRFLERFWNLSLGSAKNKKSTTEILIALNRLIKKVTEDLDAAKFNTAVAAFMEFSNFAAECQNDIGIDAVKELLVLFSPFAPHIAEELWSEIGNKKSINLEKWPKHDDKLTKQESVTIIVQINGKVRDKIEVSSGMPEEEVKKMCLAREKIKPQIEGKEIKKIIFVKDRLVNIVL